MLQAATIPRVVTMNRSAAVLLLTLVLGAYVLA